MKYIPILFSTAMVQAIMAGSKTMTRRHCKPADGWDINWKVVPVNKQQMDGIQRYEIRNVSQYALPWFKCPYGQPGDVLWVRETFWAYGQWLKNGHTKNGKQKWKFKDLTGTDFQYKYCDNAPLRPTPGRSGNIGWYKRPSLFMPRKACRIFLSIISIKVERLQDISDKDAKAEGVKHVIDKITGYCGFDYINGGYNLMTTPYNGFRSLWKKINGAESWDANPWVWVVSFERVERPADFK